LLHLIDKKLPSDRPHTLTVVNRSPARLERLRSMVSKCTTDINIEYVCHNDALKNDELVEALPEGSLVINGTGMGKDIPGSPVTDAVVYPMNSVVSFTRHRARQQPAV
jgi:shikimate 5-dehydrogenase